MRIATKVTSSTINTIYFRNKLRVEVFLEDLCFNPLKWKDFR